MTSAKPYPRVVHLVLSLAPGGLERLVVDWANARNRLHPGSTVICCLDEKGALAQQVEGGAVICLNAHRSYFPFDLGAVRRLRKLLSCSGVQVSWEEASGSSSETQQPNNSTTVLHSHNAAAWQYGVLACLGRGTRHIHTEHGTNPHFKGMINTIRNSWLVRHTDAVVAVADAVAEHLAASHRIPRSKIRVISNGVSLPPAPGAAPALSTVAARKEIRRQFQIPDTATVIGYVGRLAHVKGCDRLIASLAASTNQPLNNSTTILLLGDGPERAALEKQADDLGCAGRVIFAGYQSDPAPYLSAMDVFVLPSRSEGLSVALLEAMGAGVPVAVTDVGENRTVVGDGACGAVLPPEEGAWANAIAAILNDPRTPARVVAARARVRECYSQEATLAGYERLYNGE